MRKSQLKRKTGLKRTGRINPVSAKQEIINENWRKLVVYLITYRAKGKCEICGKRTPHGGHHVIRRRFNIHTASNCLICCGVCHNHAKYSTGVPLTTCQQLQLTKTLNTKHNIPADLTGESL